MADKGKLVIAGGNVFDSKKEILGRFVELAGGKYARITVVVAASSEPVERFQYARETFSSLGVNESDIVCLPMNTNPVSLEAGWSDKGGAELLHYFDAATGVWIMGGDQRKLVTALYESDGSDTPVLKRMREMLDDGFVIGGSSAGAAVMSEVMIERGNDDGALNLPIITDRHEYTDEMESAGNLLITRGLGFFKAGVVDQHFNRRARIWRLIKTLEKTDAERGYGISEDTAMIVDRETGKYTVLGSASVYEITCGKDAVAIAEHKRDCV